MEANMPRILESIYHYKPNIILYLDVEKFQDPQVDRKTTMHCGLHPRVIRNILKHPYFEEWFQQLTLSLQRILQPVDPVTGKPTDIDTAGGDIVIVCARGKHRSVACAEFVREIIEEYDYVAGVNYVHQEHWRCACGGCDECHEDSQEFDDLMEKALNKYWEKTTEPW